MKRFALALLCVGIISGCASRPPVVSEIFTAPEAATYPRLLVRDATVPHATAVTVVFMDPNMSLTLAPTGIDWSVALDHECLRRLLAGQTRRRLRAELIYQSDYLKGPRSLTREIELIVASPEG